MIEMSVALGCAFALALLALRGVLPRIFTDDPLVHERAEAFWPLFALMQPIGAAVFALDGILLGAGEAGYLAASMVAASAVFAVVALLALHFEWGVIGVWTGLVLLMVVRLVTCGARFASGAWQRVGA